MPYSPRGQFTALTMPDALIRALPTDQTKAWTTITDTHTRLSVARSELSVMQEAITAAKAKDEEAAGKAVAAGKPIPKSLVREAEDAAHAKEREVAALEQLADAQERSFREGLHEAQEALSETFAAAANESMTALLVALREAQGVLDHTSELIGLWRWLRSNMQGPAIAGTRMTMTIQGAEQTISSVIDWCAEDLRKQSPEYVLRKEEETRLAWERERGLRQTADGVLADYATTWGKDAV